MDADVVIVGAGPCGCLLALRLARWGWRVVVVERRPLEAGGPSMAIGIMPPSLDWLQSLELAGTVVDAGCRVRRARVFESNRVRGTLDFGQIPGAFPFVLTLPQAELLGILRRTLARTPGVTLLERAEAVRILSGPTGVVVTVRRDAEDRPMELLARDAVLCEGARGGLRAALGLSVRGSCYSVRFGMADFPDDTGWDGEARLYFGPGGAVESFPLPGRRRRWVAQYRAGEPDAAWLTERVAAATGLRLSASQAAWFSTFQPKRRLAPRWRTGRVTLCGDAAHVMSPIGGQGMNTGLADAWHAAETLRRCRAEPEREPALWRAYETHRRRAFRVAADRAACGMWLGTRSGRALSTLRGLLLAMALRQPAIARRLADHFAMRTIPQCRCLHAADGDCRP